MKFRVRHVTTYEYEEPVSLSHNSARLVPRADGRQTLVGTKTTIDPVPVATERYSDYFGNVVDAFTLQVPHRGLVITTESEVFVTPRMSMDASRTPAWETVVSGSPTLPVWACEFALESPLVPRAPSLLALVSAEARPGRPVLEVGLALCHAIFTGFVYDPTSTTVSTPVLEVLQQRRGVCQDFSHVMLGALRSLGLPARYVSGYLETLPPPGRPRLVGADASHAWVQLYCGPELGFVDLDPTNDCIPDTRHITVAYGRDFTDVSPVKGMILGGGKTSVRVAVDVERRAA